MPSSHTRHADSHADKDPDDHADRSSSGRSGRRKESRHDKRERSERRRSRREARRSESDTDQMPKKPRQVDSERGSDKAAEPPAKVARSPHAADDADTPVRSKAARSSTAEDNAPTPDFRLSGRLAAEANTVAGVELKYSEPAEARRPANAHWRIYVFKNGKDTDMHH
ncbi:hypothetical protein IWQ56_006075, partial [Coemansia nantahalensis]